MLHTSRTTLFPYTTLFRSPDFADSTIAVIGINVEQDRNAPGPIAFQRELFISRAGQFAGPPLDRPLDVVGRHVLRLRRNDGATQARVGIRIASTVFGSNADFFDETGKNLAALGVKRPF